MGMLQHEESDFIKWGEILLLDSLSTNDMVENYIGSLSESFPIPLSCHLLNLILNAAFKVPGQLQRWRILQLEFSSQSSLKIPLQGNVYIFSRNGIKKRIWECCKKLFSVGSIERRNAYSVLSLCLSSGSWTDRTETKKKSGVLKGVITDSSEGCKIGRMERLMLRLHNPHLRYKVYAILNSYLLFCTSSLLSSVPSFLSLYSKFQIYV
ncbi:hypothetical protein Bca4012_029885 [Brassica carinata]